MENSFLKRIKVNPTKETEGWINYTKIISRKRWSYKKKMNVKSETGTISQEVYYNVLNSAVRQIKNSSSKKESESNSQKTENKNKNTTNKLPETNSEVTQTKIASGKNKKKHPNPIPNLTPSPEEMNELDKSFSELQVFFPKDKKKADNPFLTLDITPIKFNFNEKEHQNRKRSLSDNSIDTIDKSGRPAPYQPQTPIQKKEDNDLNTSSYFTPIKSKGLFFTGKYQ
ncbi:hypothetical protein ACTA71_010168 [Dictyostelium dimigraforme]